MYNYYSFKTEYFERNPHGVMHVRLNDVIFPAYALLCTIIQIGQCFFLKVSKFSSKISEEYSQFFLTSIY